jgi:hypothetical protein
MEAKRIVIDDVPELVRLAVEVRASGEPRVLRHDEVEVAVLRAETVPAERLEEWAAARVRGGVDVPITEPGLAQTGPDYEESVAVSSAAAEALPHSPSSSRIHRPSAASRSRSASSGVG